MLGVLLVILGFSIATIAEFEEVFTDKNSCYAHKAAKSCDPPYENLSEGFEVNTTSECGLKDEEVCRKFLDNSRVKQTFCQKCNKNSPLFRLGGDILTNPDKSKNGICWTSDIVTREPGKNVVNVTISFGKRFEISSVSIKPCGQVPDAIAIYKSADHGKTWIPWQYYSVDCYRAFALPSSPESVPQLNVANITEAVCTMFPEAKSRHYNEHGQWIQPLTFNTKPERRASIEMIDFVTATDVRITMSRFSLIEGLVTDRFQERFPRNDISYAYPKVFSLNSGNSIRERFKKQANFGEMRIKEEENVPVHFSLASINIYGRCRCNGHSNKCVRDIYREKDKHGREVIRKGPLRCACTHNTEGVDCERCADGYLDQPWAAGNGYKVAECKACQCNNHAKTCRFNANIYIKSNYSSGSLCDCVIGYHGDNCQFCSPGYSRNFKIPFLSPEACYKACECTLHSTNCTFSQEVWEGSRHKTGGVCNECQHNTTGRKCQHCANGFYRDWDKSMSHENACIPCNCNPFGSISGADCDRRTGQCNCKEGVVGLTCANCATGYIQTNDGNRPCIKEQLNNQAFQRMLTDGSQEILVNPPQNIRGYRSPAFHAPTGNGFQCPSCEVVPKRLGARRFCRRHAVFLGTVKGQTQYREEIRYDIELNEVWKASETARRFLPVTNGPVHDNTLHGLWIPITIQENGPINCKCPRLQQGNQYLFFARLLQKPHAGKMEMQIMPDMHSVIPWQEFWRSRITRMLSMERANGCPSPRVRDNVKDSSLASPILEGNGRRRLIREHAVGTAQQKPNNRLVAVPSRQPNPYLAYQNGDNKRSQGVNIYGSDTNGQFKSYWNGNQYFGH